MRKFRFWNWIAQEFRNRSAAVNAKCPTSWSRSNKLRAFPLTALRIRMATMKWRFRIQLSKEFPRWILECSKFGHFDNWRRRNRRYVLRNPIFAVKRELESKKFDYLIQTGESEIRKILLYACNYKNSKTLTSFPSAIDTQFTVPSTQAAITQLPETTNEENIGLDNWQFQISAPFS